MARAWLAMGLILVSAVGGCDKLRALNANPQPPSHPHAQPSASATHGPVASASAPVQEHAHTLPHSDQYGVPFAWEKSKDEPLAYARAYLQEVLRDNQTYRARAKEVTAAKAKSHPPRATVVACSDAMVQSGAWDATPENDSFTVRNLGNQISPSMGSVRYGVEHLHTPVLLILGHTGCEAINVALEATESTHQASATAGKEKKPSAKMATIPAVVANIHQQVKLALEQFAPLIVTGKLTVVGAVYDLADELGKGAGRLTIVNVNGNSESKRLKAFVEAISQFTAIAAKDQEDDTEGNSQGDEDDGEGRLTNLPPSQSTDDGAGDPIADDLRAAFASITQQIGSPPPAPSGSAK